MANYKQHKPSTPPQPGQNKRKQRPALSPEAREAQMINLAMDCAERQMLDGTASSQVITHFLKLGSIRAELEKEKIIHENEKLKAQAKAFESAEEAKVTYDKVLKAIKKYNGYDEDEDGEFY